MNSELFDTREMSSHWKTGEFKNAGLQELNGNAMYVMDPNGKFYAAPQIAARFHHSSFLAGGPVAGAGEMTVKNGQLLRISNSSGHYLPDVIHMVQVLRELSLQGVNLQGVQLNIKYQKGPKDGFTLSDAASFYKTVTKKGEIKDPKELQNIVQEHYQEEQQTTKQKAEEIQQKKMVLKQMIDQKGGKSQILKLWKNYIEENPDKDLVFINFMGGYPSAAISEEDQLKILQNPESLEKMRDDYFA